MSEMEQRAIKYGQWLKSNMDKKDTPEWAKVAEGYKQARALMQQPQQQPQEPDTSFASALKFGFDQSLENVGDSAEVVGATDVAQSLRDFTDAPKNYKPADFIQSGVGEWYDPRDYNWSEAPRAIAESAASMAASIGGGAALGSVGGPVGGVIGAAAGPVAETFGPVVKERMRRNNASEPTTADYLAGGATALGVGALSAFGARGLPAGRAAQAVAGRRALKTISNAATKTSREGLAEGVQDLGQQVGETVGTETGLQIDKKRAVGAGALGAGTRAAMPDIAINTPIKLVDAVLGPQTKVRDREGATYFANRIERISESEGVPVDSLEKLNYANPSDSKVFKTANKEIRREVVNNYNAIKPLLADLSIEDKSVVEAGIMAGQNLFEGISTKDSMQLIQDKAGHTQEGQNLIRLLRESNEASNFMVEMRKSRKGGITGKVDNFLGRKAKEIATSAAGGAVGTAGVLQVAGALPAAMGVAAKALPALGAGATLYAGARALDKVTGRRSKAARYLEDYAGRDVTPIGGESIAAINQRQLEAAKAAQAAQEAERTAFKMQSDSILQPVRLFPSALTPEWLADNYDQLTEADRRYAERKLADKRKAEEAQAKVEQRDRVQYEKAVAKETRNRVLMDLMAADRDGSLEPAMVDAFAEYLTPAQHDRFMRKASAPKVQPRVAPQAAQSGPSISAESVVNPDVRSATGPVEVGKGDVKSSGSYIRKVAKAQGIERDLVDLSRRYLEDGDPKLKQLGEAYLRFINDTYEYSYDNVDERWKAYQAAKDIISDLETKLEFDKDVLPLVNLFGASDAFRADLELQRRLKPTEGLADEVTRLQEIGLAKARAKAARAQK